MVKTSDERNSSVLLFQDIISILQVKKKFKWVLPCITGALWAKRNEHGILREARDEGRRRNKAPVTSPLFWLFRPIKWRRWSQKDQSKHDPLLENCPLSGYQKQNFSQEKLPKILGGLF